MTPFDKPRSDGSKTVASGAVPTTNATRNGCGRSVGGGTRRMPRKHVSIHANTGPTGRLVRRRAGHRMLVGRVRPRQGHRNREPFYGWTVTASSVTAGRGLEAASAAKATRKVRPTSGL